MAEPTLRSARWFAAHDLPGFLHRASSDRGFSRAALDGRPVVGICNSWSEVVNCNVHFRGLAEAVQARRARGRRAAARVPDVSRSARTCMKPTTMLFRNLMAMDVEEAIRSYPFDAVVLIGGCDKTRARAADGRGQRRRAGDHAHRRPRRGRRCYRGRELSVGTDLWRYTDELRAGTITLDEYDELEAAWIPSPGHCNEMGTASTMACVIEALGMTLPGTATIPALTRAAPRSAEADRPARRRDGARRPAAVGRS